jgi:hypothetical protein
MRQGAAALLAACAVGALAAQSAVAATSPIESVSTSSFPANRVAGTNWSFNSTACGSESCVTVGSYEFVGPPSSQTHGLIVPIKDGVAGAGMATTAPSNIGADSSEQDQLYGVSCWSKASCVAVGYYTDSGDHQQALVVPITNGIPGQASEVTLPGNQAANPQAQLDQVSCSASGSCVAAGYYTNNNTTGDNSALVVDITNGVPAAGIDVHPPSSSANPSEDAGFDSVSCQANGSCAAVGWYYYDASDSLYAGLVVPITNGMPGTPAEVTALPSNTSGQDWYLQRVACPAAGTCTAVGVYNDYSRSLVVPITNGVPGQGAEATAPSGASTSVGFNGLSCQSSGACLAVGSYGTTAAGTQAAVIPIQNGVPSASDQVALPSDAEAGSNQLAELNDVNCPASGACLAVGDYRNLTGNSLGMTVSFDAGNVGAGVATQAPADESTAGNAYAVLESIGCASSSCAASGGYSSSTSEAPYVLSAQAPLAVGTTTLPAGAIGSAYSQTLSATGAWGAYNWTVTSGSLPAGLGLDSATGIISGTPTAAGTSTVTVKATGTGAPVQTATQSLSLTVAAVHLSVASHSATVRRNRFGLRLHCSGGACAGVAKLQARQTYTVKHGKRRVRRHRTVTIGAARFSLTAGQTHTYTVALNAAGRRALVAGHRLSVTVLATVDAVKETAGHLTLKAPAARHRKK